MNDFANVEQLLVEMPEERRQKIEEGTQKLITEYTLQQIRKQSQLTQTDMASRLGVSQSSIRNLEEHYGEAKVSTLKRYCAAMGAVMTISITAQDGTTYTLP
uniref:HTH cro/C1-type domain-containing protein n=1 Tax=uncultured prokaryote TaxID=198431 RepID=A0A0H5Q074_9ZZZZ|nr:hypothetical protein [uncultured prokaryote]